MESLLREIYECSEEVKKILKPNGEYEQLKKEAHEYYDQLFALLGEEPKRWLDEIWTLESGMKSEWGFTAFRAGIKICLRLLAQIFTEPVSEGSEI